jgi:plasmid maintenance system antidote protein VapI
VENLFYRADPGTKRYQQSWLGSQLRGAISMHTDGKRAHSIALRHIAEALISSGYTSLDEQAKALGVHRNTAWTIVKNKHKLGRLSAKTIDRILTNPGTPPAVHAVIQQYIAERSDVGLRKRELRRTASSR